MGSVEDMLLVVLHTERRIYFAQKLTFSYHSAATCT